MNQDVLAELKKLQAEQYRRVLSAILDLLADPEPLHSAAVEGTHYRRLVISKTRVVYAADAKCIHGVAG